MSAAVTIAKLESLLALVLARSAEERPARPAALPPAAPLVSPVPQPVAAAPQPVPQQMTAPEPLPVVAAVAAAPATTPTPVPDAEAEADAKPTIPPAALPLASLDEPDVDIAPVVEVSVDNGPDIVVGESVASDDLLDEVSDSRERLVAADPFPPDPVDPFPPERAGAPGTAVIAEVDEDDAAEDQSTDEEAPASSRRPVAPAPEERLAELAFGTEEPPAGRTPPPKSGPLPSPPLDFDPDVTGVRKSVPPGTSHSSEPPPPARLTPHVAHLQVADGRDPIVDVIGEAQRFAPPTFISLLDATLSL